MLVIVVFNSVKAKSTSGPRVQFIDATKGLTVPTVAFKSWYHEEIHRRYTEGQLAARLNKYKIQGAEYVMYRITTLRSILYLQFLLHLSR